LVSPVGCKRARQTCSAWFAQSIDSTVKSLHVGGPYGHAGQACRTGFDLSTVSSTQVDGFHYKVPVHIPGAGMAGLALFLPAALQRPSRNPKGCHSHKWCLATIPIPAGPLCPTQSCCWPSLRLCVVYPATVLLCAACA
jgi:hypothetical protein